MYKRHWAVLMIKLTSACLASHRKANKSTLGTSPTGHPQLPYTYECACGPGQVTELWLLPASICSSPHSLCMCPSQHLDMRADGSPS